IVRLEEVERGRERFAREPFRLEKHRQGIAHRLVVVDHVDEGLVRVAHSLHPSAAGSSSEKTAPPSGLSPYSSLPPEACAIVRLMARPTPRPVSFVVTKGSKIFSPSDFGTPGP